MFTATFKFYNWKPDHASQLWTLLYPFDRTTWLFLLASCLLACWTNVLTIAAATRVSWFQNAALTLGPIVKQPMPESWLYQHSAKGNTFLKLWILCGTLVSTAYTSNLLANLVKVRPGKAVDTFEQLLEGQHTLGVLGGSSLLSFMTTSNNKVIRQVYEVNIANLSCHGLLSLTITYFILDIGMDQIESTSRSIIVGEQHIGTDIGRLHMFCRFFHPLLFYKKGFKVSG